MSAERDLAEAIYDAISSAAAIDTALALWSEFTVPPDRDLLETVICAVASDAIGQVLARRQREAARSGPWGEQHERMQDALEQIVSWSEAYPLDIFPEPDLKKAQKLLEAGGISLDAVSAYCMRHVIDGVGKIARKAARAGPWDGGHHFQEEDGYPGSLLPRKRGEP